MTVSRLHSTCMTSSPKLIGILRNHRNGRHPSLVAIAMLQIVVACPGQLRADEMSEPFAICQDESVSPSKRIVSCQRVMNDKAVESDMRIEAMLNLGLALEEHGDEGQALEIYTKIIEIDAANSLAFFNRGNVLDRIGQNDRALRDYDKAIELDPSDPEFFNNRGLLLVERGETQRGISDFSDAIKLGSKDVSLYLARAAAYEKLGNRSAAADDYRKALALDPVNAEAKDALQRLP